MSRTSKTVKPTRLHLSRREGSAPNRRRSSRVRLARSLQVALRANSLVGLNAVRAFDDRDLTIICDRRFSTRFVSFAQRGTRHAPRVHESRSSAPRTAANKAERLNGLPKYLNSPLLTPRAICSSSE